LRGASSIKITLGGLREIRRRKPKQPRGAVEDIEPTERLPALRLCYAFNVSTPSTAAPRARQERSRRTARQVIDAGTRLLEEGGPDALTIASVAEAAHVAVGSVYQRFGTKENLLAVIQLEFTEHFRAEFQDRMSEALVAKIVRPQEIVRVAVAGLAETFRTHRNLLRVFMLLGTRNESVLKLGAEASQRCRDEFRNLLLRAKSGIHHPDASRAVDCAFRLVYSMCAHRVVNGDLESCTPLSWPQMIEEMGNIISLYLFGRLDAK
jgi:AcrR family transcriptional regulator